MSNLRKFFVKVAYSVLSTGTLEEGVLVEADSHLEAQHLASYLVAKAHPKASKIEVELVEEVTLDSTEPSNPSMR